MNILLVTVVILEFYQPTSLFAEAGKKSKKYVVVKEVGTTYKKVPVYKKVPMKVLKVVIKKKKSEKPWKKWFKKEMIVKVPKKKHHKHYAAASEGQQTWALPAFVSTPSSMSEIFEAWPADYSGQQQQQQQMASRQPAAGSQPTSVADLKSVGSEEYPAFLAAAAAQLVHNHLSYPHLEDIQQQQQQQQQEAATSEQSLALTPVTLAPVAVIPTATAAAAVVTSPTVQLPVGSLLQSVGGPQKKR